MCLFKGSESYLAAQNCICNLQPSILQLCVERAGENNEPIISAKPYEKVTSVHNHIALLRINQNNNAHQKRMKY